MSKARETLRQRMAQEEFETEALQQFHLATDELAVRDEQLEDMRIFRLKQIEGLQKEIGVERLFRISAQRGLVPYVRSLQQLQVWLLTRFPFEDAYRALEPKLRALGLWNVELGYDPDEDPAIRKEIVQGKIPPTYDRRPIQHAARETMAARQTTAPKPSKRKRS